MQIKQQVILTTLGVLVTVENLMVVLAAIWNRSLRDNTHYNLVISLSVCDFIFGLILIMHGTVLMPNNDSNEEILNLSCTILNTVSGGTYQMSIVQCQTIFISFNRYLVITKKGKPFFMKREIEVHCVRCHVDCLHCFERACLLFF